jgi:hypothetical protein
VRDEQAASDDEAECCGECWSRTARLHARHATAPGDLTGRARVQAA